MTDHVAVAIIGGGPAGLTAATALARQVDGHVVVIEREAETGGIPRHSDHLGYGMRDLKRFLTGPAYSRRLTRMLFLPMYMPSGTTQLNKKMTAKYKGCMFPRSHTIASVLPVRVRPLFP